MENDLDKMAKAAEGGADPLDTYDASHGAYKDDGGKGLSDAEAWATEVNPVRETALAAKNLKSVGR
jgi:hypothetical protein